MLTRIDAPALTSIGAYLYVDRNAALSQLTLNALTHLGGSLQITSNPALASCFTSLRGQLIGYSGSVTIAGNGLTCP